MMIAFGHHAAKIATHMYQAKKPVASMRELNGQHSSQSQAAMPAGFMKLIYAKTIAIPNGIGNNYGNTFLDILENLRVGMMFVVRINGAFCGTTSREIKPRSVLFAT